MRKSSSYRTLLTLLSVIAPFVACGGSGDGDYADRMAREHAEDRPVASGAADAEPASRIDEETVVYATVDGQSVEGFLARPASANKAGLEENLRHAAGYLRENLGASKVGTIGWCFGGGWSVQTALLLPGQIDATVIYYGRVESDRQRLASLQTPILGIFGSEDQGIPERLVASGS